MRGAITLVSYKALEELLGLPKDSIKEVNTNDDCRINRDVLLVTVQHEALDRVRTGEHLRVVKLEEIKEAIGYEE